MEMGKVFVRPDSTAVLKCPHCLTSKNLNGGRPGKRGNRLDIKCTCGSLFQVFFESRRAERKYTYIHGYYAKLPQRRDWSKILVKNLSPSCIGFVACVTPNVRSGDQIRIELTWDITLTWDIVDPADLHKNATVTFVKDKYIGCKFHDRLNHVKPRHSLSRTSLDQLLFQQ
ncbi:MAG: hypothetical protein JRI47_05745 [Deltaproteobacteria bacterium]|nr:hypothetical protein [Deltaproteobacteria bacterium]